MNMAFHVPFLFYFRIVIFVYLRFAIHLLVLVINHFISPKFERNRIAVFEKLGLLKQLHVQLLSCLIDNSQTVNFVSIFNMATNAFCWDISIEAEFEENLIKIVRADFY